MVKQTWVADRVAFFNPGIAQAVQQQVHLGDRPGPEVPLLPVQGHVDRLAQALAFFRADVFRALDEHAARAAGRVRNAHAGGRIEQLDDQVHDLMRGVEFAALLARVIRELLDQIFIGSARRFRNRNPKIYPL